MHCLHYLVIVNFIHAEFIHYTRASRLHFARAVEAGLKQSGRSKPTRRRKNSIIFQFPREKENADIVNLYYLLLQQR